ncbi:hypothetical protein FDK12_02065 [Arthrobacter sp. NamB2]|uniref:hypothetical protein n=1 Tax=Arthrobacter sp. NamB2 TaxID=2576035 RepID=UPI0010C9F854|nr:hypothetical protein [Arthrobacter sp. NamB2]TKV29721.1 hypothetical protein FDK12_02065 [Arthrobacter sp. NamB2]
MEDAAAVVQSDVHPIKLDSQTGRNAILHFLLYPASTHDTIASGSYLEDALSHFDLESQARVVLVACQPAYPSLEEDSIAALAHTKLSHVIKKNVLRVLEPQQMKVQAEKHIRLALRQLGTVSAQSSETQSIEEDYVSLMGYERAPWRI